MKIKDVSIKILGGKDQIGGNIILLEHQELRILLDIGIPLDVDQNTSQSFEESTDLTDIDYCLISHAHQDHWGYMDRLPNSCVIYSGKDTQTLIRITRFILHRPFLSNPWQHFKTDETLHFGPFVITPYLIDHSAYGAHAFLIQVGGANIFYTGDIRFHGRKRVLSNNLVNRLKSTKIDLLISEGTNLLSTGFSDKSESDLEEDFVQVFSSNNHPAIVQMSGQNIDRLVTVFRACLKTNRILVLDPYTAFVASRLNNGHIPQLDGYWGIQVLMPEKDRMWERLGVISTKVDWMGTEALDFEDLKQHQNYVLIFRYWIGQEIGDHDVFPTGSDFIYSMSQYYLNSMKQQWGSLASRIETGDVKFHTLHVSGHAYPEDLLHFINCLDPKFILPIHTVSPEWFNRFGDKLVDEGAEII